MFNFKSLQQLGNMASSVLSFGEKSASALDNFGTVILDTSTTMIDAVKVMDDEVQAAITNKSDERIAVRELNLERAKLRKEEMLSIIKAENEAKKAEAEAKKSTK